MLETLAGLKLTQGAITQDALGGNVGAPYQQLRRGVWESPAVYMDDTGWRVGSESAHLMAFDTEQATAYQVRPRYRHQEVQEVVPADYSGVMVTDRGRSYEAHPFRKVKQQKFLAHLQKTLSTLLGKKRGRAAGAYAFSAFKSVIQTLVKGMLGLWWNHYVPSSVFRGPHWSLANSLQEHGANHIHSIFNRCSLLAASSLAVRK